MSNDRSQCAVLVPALGPIEPQCERSLRELQFRGYAVRRLNGIAAIDQARNILATHAVIDGFEETMWIDSDIIFDPDDVDRLRSHNLPIVCGIYPKKGKRAIACHLMPTTTQLEFGSGGGLQEIRYAGTGFLHVRRNVYETIQSELQLPVCNEEFDDPVIPYFMPQYTETERGMWYLAEDFAFCHRVRQCGFSIFADTSIRLWHVGSYLYSWEDARSEIKRHDSVTLEFRDGTSSN